MADNNHPDWLKAVQREAGVRSALILYGHIRDIFYDAQQREYVTLPELLMRVLTRDRSLGFTLTGVWDSVDGLRFPDARMLNRFHEAIGQRRQSPPAANGSAYDLGDRAAPPRPATVDSRLYANPRDLLPAIRRVLDGGVERPALILNWSHLLVTQPAHPDPEERQWILGLGKALLGPAIVPMSSDHLQHSRGLVLLLTASLGTIPPILYQGDPRIKLIALPAPPRPDRRAFFERHFDDLRCERPKAAAESAGRGWPTRWPMPRISSRLPT